MQNLDGTWAVVLAGGDGSRVRDRSRGPNGESAPKQYCSFGDGKSLLGLAIDRARSVVGPDRIVTVVAEQHRRWWEAELGRVPGTIPAENVVVQPRNRGTGVGVLLGLLHVVAREGSLARVLVLPSDHVVSDEETLRRHLERGILATRQDPGRVVLLGMTPEAPDTDLDADYGWILSSATTDGVARPVVAFREKPDPVSSKRLMEGGALVNTLIFAARAATLLLLYHRAIPELLRRLLPRLSRPEAWARDVLRRLYRTLPSRDFSRDVLERCTHELALIAVPPCGWSDLGTPARLQRIQERRAAEARRRAGGLRPDSAGMTAAPHLPGAG
jgi:mannose-1-phosphate guanylyltransferase